jgi:hypothetical protein
MAQAVSQRFVTTDARVPLQVDPCVNCGVKSGNGTRFCPGTSVSPLFIAFHHLHLHVALT